MDIEGMGWKSILRFLELGLLSDLPSIFRLKDKRDELVNLERMGDLSVDNLLNGIEVSKTRPLDRFLFGLGIRFVGDRGAYDLATGSTGPRHGPCFTFVHREEAPQKCRRRAARPGRRVRLRRAPFGR